MTAARRKGAECEGVACEHALGQQPLQLYTYLWSKASAATDDGGKQTFSFVLTDTVVFKRQKPVEWFFTSKQERGKILCKTKKFLSATRVLQEFSVSKWAPTTLPKLENSKQILATYTYLDRSSGFGEMRMVVEHLDKDALEFLLEEREKPGVSVLQRFIPTQSGYNHTMRSVYTADDCTVQKCISPFLLSDTKASLAQRTATFEIEDSLLRHRNVADKEVQRRIENINREMSTHLEAIVGKEMVRFVNYFKIGADHRIYLMWSSMISFEAGTKSVAKNFNLALGNHSTTAGTSAEDTEVPPPITQSLIGCNAQLKMCLNCKRTLPRDQVEYMVTHRSIIRQFERDYVENENSEDEERIPTLLQAISGPIHAERFKQLKQSAIYLYQTVQLCLTCARQINVESSSPSRNNNEHGNQNHELSNEENQTRASLPTHSKPSDLTSTREGVSRQSHKPVVVVHTRAQSATSIRMNFTKKNTRKGSYQYQKHLLRVLPRLKAFDIPESPSQERVRQLALHLRRAYGHPSLRFALSQCNVFPVGSMVTLRTLHGICTTDLLLSVARYWTELCHVQENSISPQTIDIDAIDSLLVASLKLSQPVAHPAAEASSHLNVRQKRLIQIAAASCPVIPSTFSATVCVPKKPDRPHSCTLTNASCRRSRLLSLTRVKQQNPPPSNNESEQAEANTGPKSLVRTVDGVRCSVQAAASCRNDGQYVLHLKVAKISNALSSQSDVVMELTLTTAEIIALLGSTGNTQHLTSQSALLEGLLPLVQIRNAQLCIDPPVHVPISHQIRSPEPPNTASRSRNTGLRRVRFH